MPFAQSHESTQLLNACDTVEVAGFHEGYNLFHSECNNEGVPSEKKESADQDARVVDSEFNLWNGSEFQ